MTDPLALALQVRILGIPLDVQVQTMPLSSGRARVLASTMANSQKIDLDKEQLIALQGLIIRTIKAIDNF